MQLLMWLPAAERPDGLLILDDNLTENACRGLVAAGIQVPEEVALVTHCNFPWPPSTVLPTQRIGFDCGHVLATCIESINSQRRGEAVAPSTFKSSPGPRRSQMLAHLQSICPRHPFRLRGVIDEVQRRPELFEALRVLLDRPGTPARFLLTGSALPDLAAASPRRRSAVPPPWIWAVSCWAKPVRIPGCVTASRSDQSARPHARRKPHGGERMQPRADRTQAP